jgi:hypothetical protein
MKLWERAKPALAYVYMVVIIIASFALLMRSAGG